MATVERRISALEQARGDGHCIACELARITALAERRENDVSEKCAHPPVSLIDLIRIAGRANAEDVADAAW